MADERKFTEDDLRSLVREYKRLGGANGASILNDSASLNTWEPSEEAAKEFWRLNVETLPREAKEPFLRLLAEFGP